MGLIESEILPFLVQKNIPPGAKKRIASVYAPVAQLGENNFFFLLRAIYGHTVTPQVLPPGAQPLLEGADHQHYAAGRGQRRRPAGNLHQEIGRRVPVVHHVHGHAPEHRIQKRLSCQNAKTANSYNQRQSQQHLPISTRVFHNTFSRLSTGSVYCVKLHPLTSPETP